MRFFLPFIAVLLGGILLVDWFSGANDRAIDRFQQHAMKILRERRTDRTEVPAGQLFGADSAAICFFEAGYHPPIKINMPQDLQFVLPILQKEGSSSGLENWEIFAVSVDGVRRLDFSHGGDIQLSSRSGSGQQCIRPTAMLALGSHPSLDVETLTIDFP